MKRLAIIALLVVLTSCGLPHPGIYMGFLHARDHSGTIVVDNRSHMGVPADQIVGPWNVMAGRGNFLVALPRDHPDGANAHIRFEIKSPICPYGDCSDRRAAGIERTRNPDGSIAWCTIYFDPWIPALPWSWLDIMRHEFSHCLDFTGPLVDAVNPDYKGVASYYPPSNWWGAADAEMVTEAGY